MAEILVRLGDGIEGLLGLAAGSADLILSDLPSGETRAPFDRRPDLSRLWPAAWRALRPGGIVIFMASSLSFASQLLESQRRFFRYEVVWHKSLATAHLNARRRPLRAHEYALVFWREAGGGIYRPQMVSGATPIHRARRFSNGENYGPSSKFGPVESRAGATDRYPTTVLEFGSVGTSSRERTHPQQKPVPLLRWFVETYARPGDLVVDPYAGSGSTGRTALECGRRFLGWDDCPRFGGR